MKSAHDSNMQTIQPAKRGGRRIGAGRARTKALIDLINQKRAGKPVTAKTRPRGENVVDLMQACE
jgi:hypothetical protein